MIRVGVIGYGYWGPNIVRNFMGNDRAEVTMVCDTDQEALARVKKIYPNIDVTKETKDIFSSPKVDAVAIITPVSTHFDLAKQALQNGKHIFVEKPLTATVAQAEEIIELADRKNLKIMVDHTFLYTGAVDKIKSLVESGELGDLYYFDSMRVNLGLLQPDINVIWDLAPHDFSIMDYLIKEKPAAFVVTGKAHVNMMENIAYITAYFNNNLIAHFNLNWLSPVKIRLTLIGGEKKMVVWDDVVPDEKIKVYDKGVKVKETLNGIRKLLVSYRSGDLWVPRVEQTEALKLVVEAFTQYILDDKTPINDGYAGLRVVKMLEACSESIKNNGKMIRL